MAAQSAATTKGKWIVKSQAYIPMADTRDLPFYGNLWPTAPKRQVPLSIDRLKRFVDYDGTRVLAMMLGRHFGPSAATSFWTQFKRRVSKNRSMRKQHDAAIIIFTEIWKDLATRQEKADV